VLAVHDYWPDDVCPASGVEYAVSMYGCTFHVRETELLRPSYGKSKPKLASARASFVAQPGCSTTTARGPTRLAVESGILEFDRGRAESEVILHATFPDGEGQVLLRFSGARSR
jgi:hypothetical protein